jgi:hypothetical protein
VALGAAAAKKDEPESEGLPGWAWGLIGLAVGAGLIWAITWYRHRRSQDTEPSDGGGQPGTGSPSP